MPDLVFLKALRDKLKGGTTRSIHLNALPGRFATRLDLGALNHIQPDLATRFLDALFTKSNFDFPIGFDSIDFNKISADDNKKLGLISKRLNSLTIENEDNYKEHGIKTFGFGFPILVKRLKQDPSKTIKAPVFIWQLDIIKSSNRINTWNILRNKSRNESGRIVDEDIHSVGLNEVLISFLKTDENIAIPQINEEILDDSVIDRTEIISECAKMLRALNAGNINVEQLFRERSGAALEPLPDSASIETGQKELPAILFGGVFGLFRTQKESIVNDLESLITRADEFQFENLKIDPFTGTALSAIETDPSQQEILSTLNIEPKKIIQGPPGTGKSQSLTALITNALANGLKCLIVCEKKTALDVIKNNLDRENAQLGALAAVIEDINKDRDGIVSSVRDRISMLQYTPFNQTNYVNIVKTVEEKAEELNRKHQLLDQSIYLGKTWPELVGEYLKLEKSEDISNLKTKLDHKLFKFADDENEFAECLQIIKTARTLHKELDGADHPLDILSDEVFQEENVKVVHQRLSELPQRFINDLSVLRSDLQKQSDEYAEWIELHFDDHYQDIKKQISVFNEFVVANSGAFGPVFFKNDGWTRFKISFIGVFSGRYKLLSQRRNELLDHVARIREIQQSFKYFEHSFPNVSEVASLHAFVEDMDKLNGNTDKWYEDNRKVKADFKQFFSSANLHPQFSAADQVAALEQRHRTLIGEINAEKFLRQVNGRADDHLSKIEEIDRIISEMNIVSENLDDFRSYYEWRKFYIGLSDRMKKMIRSLIEAGGDDWSATFQCWYYHWLLSITESRLKGLPKNSDPIAEFIESKEKLKKLQIKSIVSNWANRQIQALKPAQEKGFSPISLYNKRGSKGERRNSLRKIINTDFDLFTDFFPVVLISPGVCSSIIPLAEGLFDIVIFDEASQLRLEDTYSALIRGKIKVVSGDSQQMPPSNFFQGGTAVLNPTDDDYDDEMMASEAENVSRHINNSLDLADSESLLVYAENNNYKQSYLRIHYRSQHPHLIDFSNHAFYGKRLIAMPAKREYRPIQFIEVNGLYEDQVNRDEAKQVVDIILNHIKKNAKGKYPTVGVATFNLYQRNLILEEITKARQENPKYDQKIADLEPDLFVKNLENIQGDERDVIIISTTFGRNPDGSFRQNFGPIIQRNGYKLLNVIVTRAKQMVYVCTSVPLEHYSTYSTLLQQMKSNGRAIFYAYLAYAKAVSEGNEEVRKGILEMLYTNSDSKSFEIQHDAFGSESPFEEEVYYRLATKIDQARLQQQFRIGGFRIDLVVKSKLTGKPVIAIECDGAKYHSSREAYAWDVFRQTQLERQGFVFHRIWSTNWWHSPEKELKKMVDFIEKFDKEEKSKHTAVIDDAIQHEVIVPINKRSKKVAINSLVTVKDKAGKVFKVRFSKTVDPVKQIANESEVTVSDRSALAAAIMGRNEGEVCQPEMVDEYYHILKVE